MAQQTKSDSARQWDLIGLNECFAKRTGTYDVNYVEQEFVCLETNCCKLAAECFDAGLRAGSSSDLFFQKGEIGIVARNEKFERADDHVMTKRLGYRMFNTLRRHVLGVRLTVKETGHVIPFFSTHISAFEDKWWTRDQHRVQLEDLVSAIRQWWKRGDLTPIVVGDFNSDVSWNDEDWAIMEEDFSLVEEATEARGPRGGIEHIWIGRRNRFKGSSGSFIVDRGEYLRDFKDKQGLSDHGVPFAIVSGPTPRYLGNIHPHESYRSVRESQRPPHKIAKEVHDLDYEKKQCQIREILQAGHGRWYERLEQAHDDGYDNCAYCIGNSNF
jgi:hypothetical protein